MPDIAYTLRSERGFLALQRGGLPVEILPDGLYIRVFDLKLPADCTPENAKAAVKKKFYELEDRAARALLEHGSHDEKNWIGIVSVVDRDKMLEWHEEDSTTPWVFKVRRDGRKGTYLTDILGTDYVVPDHLSADLDLFPTGSWIDACYQVQGDSSKIKKLENVTARDPPRRHSNREVKAFFGR